MKSCPSYCCLLSSSSDNYWALAADFVVNLAFDPRELILIKGKGKIIEALIPGEAFESLRGAVKFIK